MAEKVVVTSPEGVERLVFDKPHVMDKYKALGWSVKKGKTAVKKSKAKTKADGDPIEHPRDLED